MRPTTDGASGGPDAAGHRTWAPGRGVGEDHGLPGDPTLEDAADPTPDEVLAGVPRLPAAAGLPPDDRAPGALGAPSAEGVDAERLQHSLTRAFRIVSRRDRTRRQLRDSLSRREEDPAIVEAALDELAHQGYVDDARYAARYLEDRRALEGWGPARLRQGLAQAGVARSVVDAALDADPGPEPAVLALGLLERRLAGRDLPDDDKERQRALRFLVGRGHPLEVAYDAVRAYAAGERG